MASTPKRSTRSSRDNEELVQLSDAKGRKPVAVAQSQAKAALGACRKMLPVQVEMPDEGTAGVSRSDGSGSSSIASGCDNELL